MTALPGTAQARRTIAEAAAAGRALTDVDSKRILAGMGVAVSPTELAGDVESAVALAERVGYPVAMKIVSPDILHKSTYGCVALAVGDADAVRREFARITERAVAAIPAAAVHGVSVEPMVPPGVEVIIGAQQDPVFGPTLLFGLGGTMVELFDDVALRVLPCPSAGIAEMIGEVRAAPLLHGFRGSPARDVAALVGVLTAVAELALAPEVISIDLNPVVVHDRGVVVLDTTILLAPAGAEKES